jgi:nitrogen fixation protein FixH
MKIRFNWGVGVAMAYTVFAAGTLGLVVYALERPVDLVTPDYYEQSLRQDDRMAAVERVDAMGARFSADVTPDGRSIAVTVPPPARAGATGTITMYRPADAAADRTVPLRFDADGVARIPVDRLALGHWVLKVDWRSNGLSYYYERPVQLP